MTDTANPSPRCPNCGTPAGGEYCPSCGQSQWIETPTVWEWSKAFFHEVLEVNGRLPRTLKILLFQPGRLTAEWLAGRRARFVHPVRLYLFCSFVFFVGAFALPEVGAAPDSEVRAFMSENVEGVAEGFRAAGGDMPGLVAIQALGEQMRTLGPQVIFVMLPVFALLVMGFHRKSGRPYIEHLVFTVHVHSFGFLWLFVEWALVESLPLGGWWVDLPFYLLLAALGVHVVVALHKIYGRGRLLSTFKGVAILGLHGSLVFVGLFAGSLAGSIVLDLGPRAEVGKAHELYWAVQERFERGDSAGARPLLSDAIIAYRRLEAHTYDPHTRYHLGRLLLRRDEPARALELGRTALIEDSTHILALGLAARAAEELDRMEEAQEYYQRYLQAYGQAYDRESAQRRDEQSRHVPELEELRERAAEMELKPRGE